MNHELTNFMSQRNVAYTYGTLPMWPAISINYRGAEEFNGFLKKLM